MGINKLYHARLEMVNLDRAKVPGLRHRKSVHISNNRLTMTQPRELSHGTKSPFQAARGIVKRCFLSLLLTFVAGTAEAQDSALYTPPPFFEGFEKLHLKVNTSSPQAQRYFDQGLAMYYSYNFAEAARSFYQATQLDPKCSICYWGEALSLAECIQDPGDFWDKLAGVAITNAQNHIEGSSIKETAVIEALTNAVSPKGLDLKRYAENMERLHERYLDDPDITTLYVKAQMNAIGKDDKQRKQNVLQTIKNALRRTPQHPGLNHLNIHAVEAYGSAQEALESADRLPNLLPGSGHLQHMPAHIYYDLGRYHDASLANQNGIDADIKLFRQGGLLLQEFANFYLHNYYYYFSSLVMEGRFNDAINLSQDILAKLNTKERPSTPYLIDVFTSVPYLLIARFGKWDLLDNTQIPPATLPYSTGAWEYATGLQKLHSNDNEGAKKALNKVRTQIIKLEKGSKQDKKLALLLRLAALDIASQLSVKNKNYSAALRMLQKAIRLQNEVNIAMLPWYLPMKQALGNVLLQASQSVEAEKVFSEDLKDHPNNGWSLRGLMLSQQLQGKTSEAEVTRKALNNAWKYSD